MLGVHTDAGEPGDRVLIVDDVVAGRDPDRRASVLRGSDAEVASVAALLEMIAL